MNPKRKIRGGRKPVLAGWLLILAIGLLGLGTSQAQAQQNFQVQSFSTTLFISQIKAPLPLPLETIPISKTISCNSDGSISDMITKSTTISVSV